MPCGPRPECREDRAGTYSQYPQYPQRRKPSRRIGITVDSNGVAQRLSASPTPGGERLKGGCGDGDYRCGTLSIRSPEGPERDRHRRLARLDSHSVTRWRSQAWRGGDPVTPLRLAPTRRSAAVVLDAVTPEPDSSRSIAACATLGFAMLQHSWTTSLPPGLVVNAILWQRDGSSIAALQTPGGRRAAMLPLRYQPSLRQ